MLLSDFVSVIAPPTVHGDLVMNLTTHLREGSSCEEVACRASLSLWLVPSTEHSLFHQFCSALGVCVCVPVRSQGWRRAELVARLVGSGIQNLFFCEACAGTLQQVAEEMVRGIDLNVFFGEFPCCTVRHAGHLRCDREKLWTPMLGIFDHYVQDRMSDQGAHAEEATARALATEAIEQDRERMFPSVFKFETTHNYVTISSEVRELFGPLLKMVEQRIRASGAAHNELMTRSAAGTADVEGVHGRQRTVIRSSGLSRERSPFDEDDHSVQERTHAAEQEVAEEEVEEEVGDLDLSSTTISKGGQRTSASAWTNHSENKGSPRAGKGLVAQEMAKAMRARVRTMCSS